MPCAVCGKWPQPKGSGFPRNQPCHIRTVGRGGPDIHENLYPGCPTHHAEQHSIGILSMLKKYPQLKYVLFQKGWEILEGPGKYKKLFHRIVTPEEIRASS